jgi:predicted RNA-binding Zn ribbon-like protein
MVFGHDGARFSHDTVIALAEAAALVNTDSDDGDSLVDQAGLDEFLRRFPFSGNRLRTDEELAAVRELRTRLRALWTAGSRDEVAAIVNDLLRESNAQPYLTKHDEWDWHLHLTGPDAPLAQRIGAEAAMGFLDLVRADDLDRLRICSADDCSDVLVDLSKNRSKRFCDDGNCGNRAAVAAYRARKRAR